MNLEAASTRDHPFGRGANRLVLAGTTLSIIQSLVVAMGVVAAPLSGGFELRGLPLAVWLLLGTGLPVLVGWTALRALRSWWHRSISAVRRIVLAALLAAPSTFLLSVPLGDERLDPIGYLPASVLMLIGARLARPRVAVH